MENTGSNSVALPDGYIDQIHDLLEHLYDPAYLQNHILTKSWVLERGLTDENGAAQIRRTLIEAIESANPGGNLNFRIPQARPHQMLILHYVERLTIQKAAHELGVSERQAYRDLRQGEEIVAIYLHNQATRTTSAARSTSAGPSFFPGPMANNLETERTETTHSYIDLLSLIWGAVVAVGSLSAQQKISLEVNLPDIKVMFPTEPAVARQVLVNLFSRAIQQAQGQVQLNVTNLSEVFEMGLIYPLRKASGPANTIDGLVQYFIQQLGWTFSEETNPDHIHRANLHIPKPGVNLLMIDDDEGFIALIRRYLTGYPVYITAARNGADGIIKAQQEHVSVILLDVMMPGLDGWEVLQTLRTDLRTMNIPVIICSVFNDPELARSLGASLLLPKPTSQEDVIAALEWLGQFKNR